MNYSKLAKFLLEGHGCVDCEKFAGIDGGWKVTESQCFMKLGTPQRGFCKYWNAKIIWPRPAKRT
jgi:hypothetical protein